MTVASAPRPISTDPADLSAELSRRAEDLAELLRSNAARADADRRIPQENIDALAASGLFKLAVPERLGGYEADFTTFLKVTSTLAQSCGSTAWVATLINVGDGSSGCTRIGLSARFSKPIPMPGCVASLPPMRPARPSTEVSW